MHKNHLSFEKGQSMVLVALMVVAFGAMLALVLDGGTAYAARRKAQNAADAGALAGAQYLCSRLSQTGVAASAGSKAAEYAVTRNGATRAVVDVSVASRMVTVTASIRQDTFFAGLIGNQVYTATAVAAAKCSPPGGRGILPIAWACRPPIAGSPSEFDCAEYADDPNYKYLIMDSPKLENDLYCKDPITGQPAGALDCDVNNDGINEVLAGGDRSWLDLDGGGGGASELVNWITNGFPGEIRRHTWLPAQSGTSTSVFQAAESKVNKDVLIPVFDMYCVGDPRYTAGCEWHSAEPSETLISGGGTYMVYFHIIGFATFRITCVEGGKYKCTDTYDEVDAVFGKNAHKNMKWIEGYFVRGHYAQHGTGDENQPWTGSYVVRLVR